MEQGTQRLVSEAWRKAAIGEGVAEGEVAQEGVAEKSDI